jgi:hypothetical protein
MVVTVKFYDKSDDFNFPIVNYPFICSNNPAAPAYVVYIFQIIRYPRACGSYQDFLDRGLLLTRKLLNQGFILVKLKSSLRKCYGKVQKDKQRPTKHTYKTKDRVTRTPLKTGDELRCSGRVSSSCSTSGTRRVNLVTNPDKLLSDT